MAFDADGHEALSSSAHNDTELNLKTATLSEWLKFHNFSEWEQPLEEYWGLAT